MKPSIKPEIERISRLVENKINQYKEKLPYEMDSGLVLTEFGATKILKEIPFTLLSQYMKLFDHYKIRKSDILSLLKSVDKQANLVKTSTNPKSVEFSGAVNPETGELAYDRWHRKDYAISVKEFDQSVIVVKERIKASYEASTTRSKEFRVPVIISIVSIFISVIVGLLSVFIN